MPESYTDVEPPHQQPRGCEDRPHLTEDDTVGSYTIHKHIGHGAFACVYEAEYVTGSRVALKAIPTERDASPRILRALASEFEKQRQVTGTTNVLRCDPPMAVDHPLGGEWVLMPMELAHSTFRAWMREHEDHQARTHEGLSILAQVCDGALAIHDAGLVHLDLKPENVLLVRQQNERGGGIDWTVKIGDFGLARVIVTEQLGRLIKGAPNEGSAGTPEYMAPEQIDPVNPLQPNPKSDVYSIGSMLYELLLGTPPYTGEPKTIKENKKQCRAPKEIDNTLAMWCLDFEPESRPTLNQLKAGLLAADSEEAQAWQLAEVTDTPQAYTDFLKEFPRGRWADEARRRVARVRESAAWSDAKKAGTIEAYKAFSEAYPGSERVKDAHSAIETIKAGREAQRLAWSQARDAGDARSVEAYLRGWKNGVYAEAARKWLADEDALWRRVREGRIEREIQDYLENYPRGRWRVEAQALLTSLLQEAGDWRRAIAEGTAEAIQAYLDRWPGGVHANEAQQWLERHEREITIRAEGLAACVSFSIAAPPMLAVGVANGTLQVFVGYGDNPRQIYHDALFPGSRTQCSAWRPLGDVLAIGASNGRVKMVRPAVNTVEQEHNVTARRGEAAALRWSRDGRTLAAGTNRGEVRFLPEGQGRDFPDEIVMSLDWTENGEVVVALANPRAMRARVVRFSPDPGGRVTEMMEQDFGRFTALRCGRAGDVLVAGDDRGSLHVQEGGQWRQVDLSHRGRITDLALSPEGTRVVSGDSTGVVIVSSLPTGRAERTKKYQHPVAGVDWSGDGWVSVAVGNEARLWWAGN